MRSHAVDAGAGVRRRLRKHEILGVEVRDIGVLEPNRAAAILGEVDHGSAPVGGNGQIVETGNAGDLAWAEPWPGTIFGGRFPIDVWPRALMWAFEWHDTERELRLARGEPLFYCQFETIPQDRPVQLIEAARTPELDACLEHIAGAANFVNWSFSLFKTAKERRPKALVVPRKR